MKKLIITALTITAVNITSLAWGAAPPPANPVAPPAASSYATLIKFLKNYYEKTMNFITQENYAPIPGVAKTQNANTTKANIIINEGEVPVITNDGIFGNNREKMPLIQKMTLTPGQAIIAKASEKTTDNLNNTLKQFFYAMHENDPEVKKIIVAQGESTPSGQPMPFSEYLSANSAVALANAPGSDTLYAVNPNSQNVPFEQQVLIRKPKTTYDENYNFSSLMSPIFYATKAQETSAHAFIKYAAQSTMPLTIGFEFSRLHNKSAALAKFKTTPDYTNFVITMRALLAIRSISIQMLNQLVAERTPMDNLGKAINSTSPYASPLQVEEYQANHRVQDPNWYAHVANASTASIQRNILIELAEIEHQNYQAHLDRENILAAITASNLQSNLATMQTITELQKPKVNQAITDSIRFASGKPPEKKTTPAALQTSTDSSSSAISPSGSSQGQTQ